MSDEPAEQLRGRRQTVSLARLYLDPNNYRIVDNPEYRPVAPEAVFNPDVQRRTTRFVLGRSQENVRDLTASIKENGWLDIDPILVERRDGGRYLVLEGNRRVATLKHLQSRYEEDSIDLGRLDPAVFSRAPVVFHEFAGERQRMVMMGLHHITGKRRWPAVNRAMAMRRLQEHFDGDADAVCNALGISKREFNLSVRTLALVEAYKESDYGDQFRSDQYNLFREVLNSPSVRDWLGWDHTTCTAARQDNLDRLFHWVSPELEDETGDEGEDIGVRAESSAVLTTVEHIRELEKIIDDPEAIKRLNETRSLQEATLSSSLLVKNEIDRAFGSRDTSIQKLNKRVGDLVFEVLDRVDQLAGRIQEPALAHKRQPFTSSGRLPWQPFNELTQSQFSDVRVQRYRGLDGLALDGLKRINLIAGVNNAGKTSLLEAIYLLTRQNDEAGLLDVIRWRGRIEGETNPFWLVDQIPPAIRIEGHFDDVDGNSTSLNAQRVDEPGEDIEDQTSFLAKLALESSYAGHAQSTDVALFSDRPRRASFQGRHWLCRSAFTSPFWVSRADALSESNKAALEAGTKAKVIDFIKEHLDSRMTNIELADKFNRFLVSHQDFDRAPDLSSFGDDLWRIFEIGLLFAGVQGGVLLIDEFENAIHTALLVPFTRMVQELAADLNVQVFLTTHSKEVLDAFTGNEYKTEDVAGYAICRDGDGAGVRRFDGCQLQRLHRALDFDLRGIRKFPCVGVARQPARKRFARCASGAASGGSARRSAGSARPTVP